MPPERPSHDKPPAFGTTRMPAIENAFPISDENIDRVIALAIRLVKEQNREGCELVADALALIGERAKQTL